ncbi:MAG: DMT family transporter [Coriobacteriaceae bacterium]|nr:DMT family transporter [Coriobacteriaceae bacterium]
MIYRLLIVAATLIWGSSFVIVKDATGFADPAWILVIRFLIAALIMALVFIKKRSLFFKREYIGIGLLFGVAMFFAYYLQTWGVAFTTPGKNAFLTGVYCVLVPFFVWVAHRKAPTKFNIVAAFTCIVGVGFISLGSESGLNIGDFLTLGCAVFYAIHIVLVATFAKGRDIYVLTMWQFAGVGLCSLAAAALTGAPAPEFSLLSAGQIGSLAYLTVACTTLGLLFQNIGQAHIPPASASLLLSLESPFGVFFSVLFGAELLTGKMVFGFVLVFAAIIVSEYLPERLAARKGAPQEALQEA